MFGSRSSSFYDYQIDKEAAVRQQERKDARLVLAARVPDLAFMLDILGLREEEEA